MASMHSKRLLSARAASGFLRRRPGIWGSLITLSWVACAPGPSCGGFFEPSPLATSMLQARDLIASTKGSATAGANSPVFAIQSASDPLCTTEGDAYSATTELMDPARDELFGRNNMHCKVTYNSYDLNTMLGTLTRYGALLCGIEQALGEPLAFGDAPRVETLRVPVANNPCFQRAGLDTYLGDFVYNLNPVTLTAAGDSDPDYTGIVHFIDVDSDRAVGTTQDITIKVRDDAEYRVLSLDVVNPDGPNVGTRLVMVITVDKLTNTLRMVQGAYNPNDPDYERNSGVWVSLLAKGDLVDESRFASLERVEGFVTRFNNPGQRTLKGWQTFASQQTFNNQNSPASVFWQAGYYDGEFTEPPLPPTGECQTDAMCAAGEHCRGGSCYVSSKQRMCPGVDEATCASRPGIEPVETQLNQFYADRALLLARYAEVGLLTFDKVSILGNFCGGDDLACAETCPAGFHDGGDGECTAEGSCSPSYLLETDGACVARCNSGRHDGGGGVCADSGACADGYLLESEDRCVAMCDAARHNDGVGVCVALGSCAPDFHDGGDGACTAAGTCSDGYHDDGRGLGVCVDENVCDSSYLLEADGLCVIACYGDRIDNGEGVCADCVAGSLLEADGRCVNQCDPGRHDGGNGVCVVETACSDGYLLELGGICQTECAPTRHNGGNGVCTAIGTCSPGFGNSGFGMCAPSGMCAAGFHDGGDGRCVSTGTCVPGYHNGGDASCVGVGTCSTGYQNGGRGDCVEEGTCSSAYHDGGDGTCTRLWTCAENFQDGGDGTCVPEGTCSPGYSVNPRQKCEAEVSEAVIPAGSFVRNGVEMTISRRMAMQPTEVTEQQWEALAGTPVLQPGGTRYPCAGGSPATCPVRGLTWESAVAFANELSIAKGLKPCYERICDEAEAWRDGQDTDCMVKLANPDDPLACEGYRLPTKAEWEYAYRAGSTDAYYREGSVDDIGWHAGNSGNTTHPVALLLANDFGLYDMAGNVRELVWDDYGTTGETVDAVGPVQADGPGEGFQAGVHLVRGGSAFQNATTLSASFEEYALDGQKAWTGFRLTRTLLCEVDEHDGGDGSCVAKGDCAIGYHDGGDGICVAVGGCARSGDPAGFHDGGDGSCVRKGTCAATFHDGGGDRCTAVGTCARGYRPRSDGTCQILADEVILPPGSFQVDGVTYIMPTNLAVMTTEVTQELWEEISGGTNPSVFSNCDGEGGRSCPVDNVDRFSAFGFANALSRYHGLTPCYISTCNDDDWRDGVADSGLCYMSREESGENPICNGYRLPTELQWEYAYRAGTSTQYYNGDSAASLGDIAWHVANADATTHPVGLLAPNAFGLFDMAGNVAEWTSDCSHVAPSDTTVVDEDQYWKDPGFCSGSSALGGGIDDSGFALSAKGAAGRLPGYRGSGTGLRLVRLLPTNPCASGLLYESGGRCAPACDSNRHDGGVGVCVPVGVCAEGYHDNGLGVCVPPGICGETFHDGGDGVCLPLGACSNDFHDGGDGTCVSVGTCLGGFELGGLGGAECRDIDECEVDNGGCGDAGFVTCINEVGADPTCADIDECEIANGGCGDPNFFKCINTYGQAQACEETYCGDGITNRDEECDGEYWCADHCVPWFVPPCRKSSVGCPDIQFMEINGGTFSFNVSVTVDVGDYQLMRSQVTVEMYKKCVEAGVCEAPCGAADWQCNYTTPGREAHPINFLSWHHLMTFAHWVGARLPSEAEWEYASRSQGGQRTYPWGNEAPSCDLATFEPCGAGTQEVCSHSPAGDTDQGLCDMAGNVYEWVQDEFHGGLAGFPADGSGFCDAGACPKNAGDVTYDADDPAPRVLRGGGWSNGAPNLRTTFRLQAPPDTQYSDDGGRLALSPRPPPPPCTQSAGGCPKIEFVKIEGGSFQMGQSPDTLGASTATAPVHEVTLASFEMMKTEVTVRQYGACVEAGYCTLTRSDDIYYTARFECNMPRWQSNGTLSYAYANDLDDAMNCMSWHQLMRFAQWVGARLPTESEWEFAVRSRGMDYKYVWGNHYFQSTYGHFGPDTDYYARSTKVCSHSVNTTFQGLCDMTGNVAEYVQDEWHETYDNAPSDGSGWCTDACPRDAGDANYDPNATGNRVLRGGSFTGANGSFLTWTRTSGVRAGFGTGGRLARPSPSP